MPAPRHPQLDARPTQLTARRPQLTARRVRTFDALLVGWIVLWVLVGVLVGRAIWGVGGLADPVVRSAQGLQETAEGFERLSAIPLIGGVVGGVVGDVAASAQDVQDDAQAAKARIHAVGVFTGLLLALGPIGLALVFYLPLRLPWRRDVQAVRAALARDPSDPVLQRYLAARAVDHLAYDDLRALSDDPWRDMEGGAASLLAAVELRRLGIEPPP